MFSVARPVRGIEKNVKRSYICTRLVRIRTLSLLCRISRQFPDRKFGRYNSDFTSCHNQFNSRGQILNEAKREYFIPCLIHVWFGYFQRLRSRSYFYHYYLDFWSPNCCSVQYCWNNHSKRTLSGPFPYNDTSLFGIRPEWFRMSINLYATKPFFQQLYSV